MKLASVLAGATAVALALTATAASASGPVYRGAATGTFSVNTLFGPVSVTGTAKTGEASFFNIPGSGSAIVLAADAANPGIDSNVALFTMDSAGFANNTAATTLQNGATFSLSGTVSQDCAYYTGGTNTTVNFGEIGINTSDNNPGAAFEMVGNDRTLDISSNLAGCNTKNTVTFTKTDLSTSAAAGFDAAQFTNVIPVELDANFTAGGVGATNNAGPVNVSLTQAGNQAAASTYGAWKSPLNMVVKMKNPGKGLLAGTYNGTVSLTIAVAQ